MKAINAFVLAAFFAASHPAQAHTPGRLNPQQPTVVERPKDSYAIFGIFDTGLEQFVIRLSYAERFAAPVEIFVPHAAPLSDHRPAYAVVGLGLPVPTDVERAALPKPLPDGWGAIVELNNVTPRPVFFESIMRRFFWTSGALGIVFPKGNSEIWIWSPNGSKGKFGIGFGVEEGGGYMNALADWSFYAY